MTSAGFPAPGDLEQHRRQAEYCISRCTELTDVLKRCLAEERTALEQRDAEALERALTSKRECIRQLEEADLREHLPDTTGGGAADEGIEAWLEALADDGRLKARWRALMQATRECRELNAVNGRLAGGLRERAEQTLLLLRGAAADATVYGPDGALSLPRLDR